MLNNETVIQIGDVFVFELIENRPNSQTQGVVTHVDEVRGILHEHPIIPDQKPEMLHPWGETLKSKRIIEITGHWDPERVVRALLEGEQQTGLYPADIDIDQIRREASAPLFWTPSDS